MPFAPFPRPTGKLRGLWSRRDLYRKSCLPHPLGHQIYGAQRLPSTLCQFVVRCSQELLKGGSDSKTIARGNMEPRSWQQWQEIC
jgi:hypothetical protein